MEKSLLKTVATLFLFRNYAIIFFETTSFNVAPDPTKAYLGSNQAFAECSQVPLAISTVSSS